MEFLPIDLASLFVYLAFFIVIGLIVTKGKNAILGTSYARIKRIKNEIATAEKLRTDAQNLLGEQEKKFRESLEMAEQLITDAREKSIRITEQAEQKADDIIARAKQRAEKTIQQAEDEAHTTLQNEAVDRAFEIVKNIAIEQGGKSSFDSAISDIKKFN